MPAHEINPDIPQLQDNTIPEASISPELAGMLGQYMSGPNGLREATRSKGLYMYYRQPNGNITLSPCFIYDMMRYMMEGWVPLPKYGRFKLNQYYHENMYEVLLQKGGAAEFTKEQATELRFHMRHTRVPGCGLVMGQNESFSFQERRGREDLIPNRSHVHDHDCFAEGWDVEFPQFTGNERIFTCNFCGDEHTTQKALDGHVQVMHADRVGAHATALALADAITSAMKKD